MIRCEGRRVMKNYTNTKVRIRSYKRSKDRVLMEGVPMYMKHICPFYEEYAGEYYQGCWEFYDVCWCSQDLGINPTCYSGCFLVQNDEEKMLEVCLSALKRKRKVYGFKVPIIERDLTDYERLNIINDMNTFIRIFNERFNPSLLYE